jgi:WD40 repeat protein
MDGGALSRPATAVSANEVKGIGMGHVRRGLVLVSALLISATLEAMPADRANASPRTRGDELWVSRFNGPGDDFDSASAIAVSPDGSTVFVLGDTDVASYGPSDWVTLAYDAATGLPRWVEHYGSAGFDYSQAIAVSPNGSRVFVTGWREGANGTSDWATVGYDAATGGMLWDVIYAPSTFIDGSRAIGVSPDSSTVFVTGLSYSGTNWNYTTTAYGAADGTKLWLRTYDGPIHGDDEGELLAVSPDGSTVFVSGYSDGEGADADYATIAYDARTGSRLWLGRYDSPYHYNDYPEALMLSPDGARVFVTGHADSLDQPNRYATVAYDAATGSTLWVRRSKGRTINDEANAAAVSPDGSELFVTGYTDDGRGRNYGTVAYDAGTGAELWRQGYDGPGEDQDTAYATGVTPDGSVVFVTGSSAGKWSGGDFGTVAYDAATGAVLWIKRYNGPGNDVDNGEALVVSPDGSTVFVAGTSDGGATDYDIATVAYGVNR